MPKISKKQLLSEYGIDLEKGKYQIEQADGKYEIFSVRDDTEGCPLLGMAINDDGIVGGTSRPAVNKLKAIVEAAIRDGKRVLLEIHNIAQEA